MFWQYIFQVLIQGSDMENAMGFRRQAGSPIRMDNKGARRISNKKTYTLDAAWNQRVISRKSHKISKFVLFTDIGILNLLAKFSYNTMLISLQYFRDWPAGHYWEYSDGWVLNILLN